MPVRRHPVAVASDSASLAPFPLDVALVLRLRATYEVVRVHQLRLAEVFYARLFAEAPELRAMFRGEPEAQAAKLTAALDAVVRNFEDPRRNAATLAELGRRHAAYGARPEHYSLVVDLLTDSIREVAGPACSAAAVEEWRLALRLISNQMIAGATHSGP